MRVISQDGTVDVPYEETVLMQNGVYIQAFTPATQTLCMARYSTEEKAQTTMIQLRNKYRSLKIEEVYSEGLENLYTEFQFPVDDEVEI